ncbi:MAG: ABC transporter ATP-binding protein, partial [Acidimicrobiia bacterium]|nr:ABC transporter ATP-binding protein [Acidimicrobiia bacterium]
ASLAVEINRRAHTAGIVLSELHYRRADLEARYLNLVSQGATT